MMLFYKPSHKIQAQQENKDEHASLHNRQNDKETHETQDAKGKWTLGAAVGGGVAMFIGGLLGVGGGNIIVPALVWLGIPAKKSFGDHAFIVIFPSLAGFAGRESIGNLDGILLIDTVIGSISGALLGSWLMSKKLQNKQVKVIIGILLYFIAAKMLFNLWR